MYGHMGSIVVSILRLVSMWCERTSLQSAEH